MAGVVGSLLGMAWTFIPEGILKGRITILLPLKAYGQVRLSVRIFCSRKGNKLTAYVAQTEEIKF